MPRPPRTDQRYFVVAAFSLCSGRSCWHPSVQRQVFETYPPKQNSSNCFLLFNSRVHRRKAPTLRAVSLPCVQISGQRMGQLANCRVVGRAEIHGSTIVPLSLSNFGSSKTLSPFEVLPEERQRSEVQLSIRPLHLRQWDELEKPFCSHKVWFTCTNWNVELLSSTGRTGQVDYLRIVQESECRCAHFWPKLKKKPLLLSGNNAAYLAPPQIFIPPNFKGVRSRPSNFGPAGYLTWHSISLKGITLH